MCCTFVFNWIKLFSKIKCFPYLPTLTYLLHVIGTTHILFLVLVLLPVHKRSPCSAIYCLLITFCADLNLTTCSNFYEKKLASTYSITKTAYWKVIVFDDKSLHHFDVNVCMKAYLCAQVSWRLHGTVKEGPPRVYR